MTCNSLSMHGVVALACVLDVLPDDLQQNVQNRAVVCRVGFVVPAGTRKISVTLLSGAR